MPRAVRFFESIGLSRHRGGEAADFTTFAIGDQHLNLRRVPNQQVQLGDVLIIFRVDSVDRMYEQICELGYDPEFPPRRGDWGERYFHIRNPDGHLLSIAERCPSSADGGGGGNA